MRNRVFRPPVCPETEEWMRLLSSDVADARASEMESHLDECAVCMAVVNNLTPPLSAELVAAGRSADASPSPDETARWGRWADVGSGRSKPAGPGSGAEEEGTLPFEKNGQFRDPIKIGEGGVGAVYRAVDVGLDCEVAIKILSSRNRALISLKEEVRRQARLVHPNIIPVHAVGEHEGVAYFSMELLKGGTLAKAIKTSLPSHDQAAEWMRGVAKALQFAHESGILHLDLKPANILLTADGVPKVGDFGLARVVGSAAGIPLPMAWAGTDPYMAPEQWGYDPDLLTPRTDVYGLGAILYELLTGRPPFKREAARQENRRRALYDEPVAPRVLRKDVPADLQAICLRCLSKRPEDRYATAGDLSRALDRYLRGFPPEPSPPATRLRYLARRNKRVTAASVALLIGLSTLLAGQARSDWQRRQTDAQQEILAGLDEIDRGKVDQGFARMSAARDRLPFGTSDLRAHFDRQIKAAEDQACRTTAILKHSSIITAAAASPDGRYYLLGDATGSTFLWDPAENKTTLLSEGQGHERIGAVAFNRDGTRCAWSRSASQAIVWDLKAGKEVSTILLDRAFITLAFLNDGAGLVGSTYDLEAPLRCWEPDMGDEGQEARPRLIALPDRLKGLTSQIIPSPDGRTFLTLTDENECSLWDSRGERLVDLSTELGLGVKAAGFSADGGRIALAHGGKGLTLWEVKGRTRREIKAGEWQGILGVTIRDDGGITLLVDKGRELVFRVLSPGLESWEEFRAERPDSLRNVVFPGRRTAALFGLEGNTIRLLQAPPTGESARADLGIPGFSLIAASADGSRIVTMIRPSKIPPALARPFDPNGHRFQAFQRSFFQVWDVRTMKPIGALTEPPGGFVALSVAMSPDGKRIAIGCDGQEKAAGLAAVMLGVLSPDGGIEFKTIGTHSQGVLTVAFTPDGERVVSGSLMDGPGKPAELACWTLEGGMIWKRIHGASVAKLAVSPDGESLAVGRGFGGNAVEILPMDQDGSAGVPQPINGVAYSLAFSPDGRRLAATSLSGGVSIFEVSGLELTPMTTLSHEGAGLSTLEFSKDSQVLYAATLVGNPGIHRWDVQVGRPIRPALPFPEAGEAKSLGFVPNARSLIVVTKANQMIKRAVPPLD